MAALTTIIEQKHAELRRAKERVSPATLAKLAEAAPPPRSFADVLASGPAPRLICEVKRASPTRGVLRGGSTLNFSATALAQAYAKAGAAALSVLTDVSFFWGSLDALAACREATMLPALRKDFVVDPYQVDEGRLWGADAVLLIVRVLNDDTLKRCAARARELGMAALVEIHADSELERALAVDDAIVGINHRDLDTLVLDRERALRLRPQVPKGRLVVAESGIAGAADIAPLSAAGIDAFLVGEHLAASDDPGGALRALLGR